MNQEIYKRALDGESTNPKQSLKLYSELEKGSRFFCVDILFLFIAGPVVAYFLTRWLLSYHNLLNTILLFLVWFGIGLYPGFMVYEKRRRKVGHIRLKPVFDILFHVFSPLSLYFSTILNLFAVCVVAAISSLPLYILSGFILFFFDDVQSPQWTIHSLPPYLDIPVIVISLLYGFLLMISYPHKPHEPFCRYVVNFRRMFVALRLDYKNAISFMIAVILLTVVNKLNLNETLGMPLVGLVTSIIGGILFSLEYGFMERDVVKTYLLQLAIIRCVLQRNKIEEADFRMMKIEKKSIDMYVRFVKVYADYPKIIILLINTMKEMVLSKRKHEMYEPVSIEFKLQSAEKELQENDPNYEYYINAINKTLELLHPGSPKRYHYVGSLNR